MPDGDPIILGQNNTSTAGTSISRNDPASQPALEVENQGSGEGLVGRSADYWGVHGYALNSHGVSGISVNQSGVSGYAPIGYGVMGFSNGTASGVLGYSANGPGVLGQSSDSPGVQGSSTNSPGVHGQSNNSPGAYGVSVNSYGVRGNSTNRAGVYGRSTNSDGVRGESISGRAGFFVGRVEITGNLQVNGQKSFRLDHPLDPENKYLNHFVVESPEMKNVYDGLVELDEDGSAWVELPEWFGELNRDCRYQLTAVGSPAPRLHIAEEVSENRLKIAGGEGGMKVSWQVTGIRKDRWAQANPIEVEEEKTEEERGRYLHPELYSEPEERGVHRRAIPEVERRIEEERQLPQPPQSLGSDVARLEEERRRLEEERMRRMGQPPQAPLPSDIDFARLEEEHRRQMEELRRRMEGSDERPDPA